MVPINSRQYLEQFTLVEPQQRQKCTSSGEPGRIHTGVLSGKNIANLNRKEQYHHISEVPLNCSDHLQASCSILQI